MTTPVSSGIFDQAREVPLESIIEHELGEALVPCGSETYEPESKTCPCGEHSDCFKVKLPDDPDEKPIAKCFSCDKRCSDGAGFLATFMGAANNYEAAKAIVESPEKFAAAEERKAEAAKHALLTALAGPAEPEAAPAQRERSLEIFEAAAAYYAGCLVSDPEAVRYQTEMRGHRLNVLLAHGVGYAKGSLKAHLTSKGFSVAEIAASGLLNKSGNDLFPQGSYIYAHKDGGGKVFRFTQKDPEKHAEWQLAKEYWLGASVFYGQHTLSLRSRDKKVILVEGENDLLSVVEAGWSHAVLATTGQISKAQLAFIEQYLKGWEVITLFDSDDAGDKYRGKVAKIPGLTLRQYRVPEGFKDPDEWLKKTGKGIDELFEACTPPDDGASAGDQQHYPQTDLGNADLLVKLADGNLRYVAEHKDFAFFDGNRWLFYQEHKAYEIAREVSQVWMQRAVMLCDEGSDEQKEAYRHAYSCQSHARITAMIKLASKDKRLLISASDFDNHPYLLGVENGVVDLRTGELLPPDRELLISKQCAVAYRPEAVCPLWESVLMHAQDDGIPEEQQAMVTYLQRVLGMALIGKVLERAFFFIHGKPGTSKTAITSAVRWNMHDYALDLSPNSLMQSSYQSNDIKMPEIVNLKGVRLALASEAEDGQRYNEGLLKRITGNDEIVARDLNQKAIHFRPQATLLITGNSRPSASGSPAFWERLKVIGCDRQVPLEERDPHLDEKLRAEGEGILAWLVRGCLDYQQHGLVEPKKVTNASAAYRADLDVISQFIEDRCVLEEGAAESAQRLYADYQRWIQDELGMKAMGRNRFYEQLLEAGFDKNKARPSGEPNPVASFFGLRLARSFYAPLN